MLVLFAILSQFVKIIAMETPQDRLEKILSRHGYSTTQSRRAVFRALEQSGQPITMRRLVETVATTVNRASVYRVVALFEQLGVIQRLQIGWKYKLELSNDFQDHHHHMTCIQCGDVTPFHEPNALHTLLQQIAENDEFTMQQHQLELRGLCKKCRINEQ